MDSDARKLLIALAIGLLWVFDTPLAAAQTLRESVEAASSREPGLEAADLTAEAARARVTSAQSGFLPRLTLGAEYGRQEIELASGRVTLDTRGTSLSLSQLLFSGGAVWAQVRQARAGAEAAGLAADTARSALIVETASVYAALADAPDAIAAIAARARADEALSERLAEIEARRREGLDTRTDYELARSPAAGPG